MTGRGRVSGWLLRDAGILYNLTLTGGLLKGRDLPRRNADPGMTPCERVLAALRHEPVDAIPWIEGIIGNGIASAVCGEPISVPWSVAPDGFPTMPGDELAEEQKKTARVLGTANLQFSALCAGVLSPHEKGRRRFAGPRRRRVDQDAAGFRAAFSPSFAHRQRLRGQRPEVHRPQGRLLCLCVRAAGHRRHAAEHGH